jgi:hypothetical protein
MNEYFHTRRHEARRKKPRSWEIDAKYLALPPAFPLGTKRPLLWTLLVLLLWQYILTNEKM